MKYRDDIVKILYKIADKQRVSIAEEKVLDEWVAESEHNRHLLQEVSDIKAMEEEVRNLISYDSRVLWKKVRARMPRKKNRFVALLGYSALLRYVAAAVIIVALLSTTIYLFYVKPRNQPEPIAQQAKDALPDIPPGGEKAILTLDDGTALVLDGASNGKLGEQGGTTIMKEDGLLAYNPGTEAAGKTYYNTVTTPRGGFYSSLVLADGSKVWLDAFSSIRFPTAFGGNERLVEITGQVYFEIARNPAKPFRVQVKGKNTAVEVLGTHFNINAYNDESTANTTLLEGSVKVISGKNIGFLKPGQQARVYADGEIKTSSVVDTDDIMAWKNGQFHYTRKSMEAIMREVSRWYGVEVEYRDKIEGQFVVTSLPRNVPVSKLLTILSHTNEVHFEIDEGQRKIIVKK